MKTPHIETNEEKARTVILELEVQALNGDKDAIKLFLEIKKQQEVDSLRKELFG